MFSPMPSKDESVLFSFPVSRVDHYRQELLADRDSPEFDEAHRGVGLSRVMTWVQRQPDYAIIRWDGENVPDALERAARSEDPLMSKWRGLVRVFAGPAQAEGVWQLESHHHVFSWTTGEEGPDVDTRIFHGSSVVNQFLTLLADIKGDPPLLSIYDRIRRRQGITRVEVWHQNIEDEDVILRVLEGHDLDAAFEDMAAGKTELDRRIRDLEIATLGKSHISRSQAELLVDWRA
jgi:hypothetical protein